MFIDDTSISPSRCDVAERRASARVSRRPRRRRLLRTGPRSAFLDIKEVRAAPLALLRRDADFRLYRPVT